MTEADSRAQQARLVLQRNREELRAAFSPVQPRGGRDFPRSATMRWITGHLNPTAIASTALNAVVNRPAWLTLAANLLLSRRRAGRAARAGR
jgi:hypothetical protein